MQKIRWGIVGPGTIANKFAVAVKNVPDAVLYGVASRTKENGEKFAQKYGIEKVFCGYEEMAKSDDIDAVYISTPHPFHRECAELFLKNKKHVLCEKPLCINAKDAKFLKQCAQNNGVFLMEAMWTRFLPAVREAVSVADSGGIGKVMEVKADFCYSITREEDEKIFKNELAGGSLLDVGVYALHFAAMFLGNSPESISSAAYTVDGVDHQMNMLLKYKSGAIASLSSAVTLFKPENAYVYGTEGYMYIPHFYGATEFYVCKNGEEKHYNIPCIGDGFEEEIIEVMNCIRNGKTESDILPLDESIKILNQMDCIRKQNGIVYPFD